MGLCYSLRPRLFGDLSGSISNATSDSDQPPDAAVPTRAGGARQEDTGGCGETSSLRGGLVRPGDPARLPAGEHRRGDTGTDGVLIQNGGGGGGGSGKGTGKDRGRRLQLLQKTSTQKQKNCDKLLVEEKEAEKEAKKVSKNIDRVLKELKREYKQTHRLLLLGRLCTSVLLLETKKRTGLSRNYVTALARPVATSVGLTVKTKLPAAVNDKWWRWTFRLPDPCCHSYIQGYGDFWIAN